MNAAFTLCLRGKHLRELSGISPQVRGVSTFKISGQVRPDLVVAYYCASASLSASKRTNLSFRLRIRQFT